MPDDKQIQSRAGKEGRTNFNKASSGSSGKPSNLVERVEVLSSPDSQDKQERERAWLESHSPAHYWKNHPADKQKQSKKPCPILAKEMPSGGNKNMCDGFPGYSPCPDCPLFPQPKDGGKK